MSELRLVPAALLCWAATWTVLAHRGWALPLLLVAVTAGIAWWLRHSGQALVLGALGSAAVLLTYLRVRAGSWPLPPLLMGRVEAAPRPVHDGVWLLRIHGETVFYRAATCAAKVGDTVQARVTARASERIGVSSHVASATHLDIIQHAGGIQAWMAGVREGFYGASISKLGEGSAQLLPAMVLGDTRGLNMDLYAGAGLAHLSAVSGSNVAIVTTSMVLLAGALTLGPRVQISLAGAALVGFVLLVGLEPSVLRAAVTGVVGLVAVLANSRSQPIHALSLAVIGLVLWDSDMAASYGFALSVVATAGIVALHPLLFRALARVSLGRVVVPEILARCLAVAIAADLVTMPIVALMSGKISAVSVVANLLAEPAVTPITILGLVAVLLPGPARGLVLWIVQPFVWWVHHVALWSTRLPGTVIHVPPGWLGVGLVVLVCLWVLALIWAGRWQVVVLGFVLLVGFSWRGGSVEVPLTSLRVVEIDHWEEGYQPPPGTQVLVVHDPHGSPRDRPSTLPDGTPVLFPERDGHVALYRDGTQHAADGRF